MEGGREGLLVKQDGDGRRPLDGWMNTKLSECCRVDVWRGYVWA